MLSRIGYYAASHPWRYVAVWLFTVAALAAAVVTTGPAFTSSITAPESESSTGLALLTDSFPSAGGDSGTIVFRSDLGATNPEVQAGMTELFQQATDIDGVVNVMSPYSPIGASQISTTGDGAGASAFDSARPNVASSYAASTAASAAENVRHGSGAVEDCNKSSARFTSRLM